MCHWFASASLLYLMNALSGEHNFVLLNTWLLSVESVKSTQSASLYCSATAHSSHRVREDICASLASNAEGTKRILQSEGFAVG